MSLSTYGEDVALDLVLESGMWYVALCFTDPGEGATGSNLNEPSGGGYARQSIAPADWDAASNGVKRNSSVIQFPTATANWGTTTLKFFALCSAATGGNVLLTGPLSTARRVLNGYTPYYPANSLTCSAD